MCPRGLSCDDGEWPGGVAGGSEEGCLEKHVGHVSVSLFSAQFVSMMASVSYMVQVFVIMPAQHLSKLVCLSSYLILLGVIMECADCNLCCKYYLLVTP